MTMANTFAAKASVAFVAIAMALSMIAPAQAQTAEELQAQIDALMATIASLQGGASATASADAYVFTRPLTIGSTGADVTALQNYLIGAGFSIPAGATGYFGAQTQAAVAAWQTANGVMPAAGYFGPVSQAKYNALMAASAGDDDSDDDASSDDDSDDTSSDELSGEASLGDVESNDGDDTDIEEGQEAAPVAEFEVEFENGDARITRIDLSFDATSNGGDEEDAWDTFEEVSLWVDGDEVASVAADDEDGWMDDEPTNGKDSLRFSGLDIVAMEDEAVTITVGVSVQGSVDDLAATWEVDMTEIRYEDADDVTSTDEVDTDAVDFEIDVEGADDELAIKSSSEDPDSTTLQVEDDANSDLMTIFAFDLDSDDSSNDIELNTIRVGLQSGTADVDDIINDLVLVIDGEEFDDWAFVDAAGTDVTVDFDIDGDYSVEAGERVTVELQAEFKQLDGVNYSAGETISATTTATGYEVEGADDVTPTGSATGDEHTLRASGLVVELSEVSETLKENADGAADDEGVFTIEFEVTAFETDVYIDNAATRGTVESNTGANYRITSGGSVVTTGTTTSSLTSTAELEGGRYLVSEGETETFTLSVEFDPATSGFHALELYSVNFNDTNDDADTQQLTTPSTDYDTDELSI